MKRNSARHRRRSIRLKGYDYSQKGACFVTTCPHDRKCSFGEIVDGKMKLSKLGQIVTKCWDQIPRHFHNVALDVFVIMPNHLHGVIVAANDHRLYTRRGTACRAPTIESFGKSVARPLPTIIRSFKSGATKKANELYKRGGSSIWQRNYYEHVIRDEEDLNEIREYIITNPLKWELDSENPSNCT